MKYSTFKSLDKVVTLSSAPNVVQNLPAYFRLNFSKTAQVIPSVSSSSTYYIIDITTSNIELLVLKMTLNDPGGGNIEVEVSNETPTFSTDIDDYQIYKTGVKVRGFFGDQTRYINGVERAQIKDEEERKRWDYFFRASPERVGYFHRSIIKEFEHTSNEHFEKFKSNAITIGAVIVVALILMTQVWPLLILIVLGYIGYRFQDYLKTTYRLYQYDAGLKKAISSLLSEIEMLKGQISQYKLTDEDMLAWIHKKMIRAADDGLQELGFENTEIRTFPDLPRSRSGINGISIEEWGLIQPLSIEGKKRLIKKHPTHFLGYRNAFVSKNDKNFNTYGAPYQKEGTSSFYYPVYGIYYINFLYIGLEKFGVFSFFFDAIKGRKFSQSTEQYYYTDIISISTRVREDYINEEVELETKQINISFPGNSNIQIALKDQVTIESLREEIEKNQEDQENEYSNGHFIGADINNVDDYARILDEEETNNVDTRANAILKIIKGEWERLKNPGGNFLPPPPIIPSLPGIENTEENED